MSPKQPTAANTPVQDVAGRAAPVQRVPAPDAPFEDAAGQDTVQVPAVGDYEGSQEQDDWLQEPEELPRRPRRRLLAPLPLSLLGVLLVACGFIGGVLVEKGQGSSSSPTGTSSSLASRLAALRGAGSGASAGAGGTNTSGAAGSGTGGFAGALAGAGGGATAGQVAFISGSTLYVTTAEGNTVKVTTSPGATVTKTVKASVGGIHPGETVVVTGTSTNGTVSAESIRVGSSGGLGGLFGGRSGGSSGAGAAGSAKTRGEPALFGGG